MQEVKSRLRCTQNSMQHITNLDTRLPNYELWADEGIQPYVVRGGGVEVNLYLSHLPLQTLDHVFHSPRGTPQGSIERRSGY
jgi:hypothetical protein